MFSFPIRVRSVFIAPVSHFPSPQSSKPPRTTSVVYCSSLTLSIWVLRIMDVRIGSYLSTRSSPIPSVSLPPHHLQTANPGGVFPTVTCTLIPLCHCCHPFPIRLTQIRRLYTSITGQFLPYRHHQLILPFWLMLNDCRMLKTASRRIITRLLRYHATRAQKRSRKHCMCLFKFYTYDSSTHNSRKATKSAHPDKGDSKCRILDNTISLIVL